MSANILKVTHLRITAINLGYVGFFFFFSFLHVLGVCLWNFVRAHQVSFSTLLPFVARIGATVLSLS